MHPDYDCSFYERKIKKQYQLVIMHEDGMTYCVGKLYSFDEAQEAASEIRALYAKNGITHHVGYREV